MKSTFFIILFFFTVGYHAQQNLIPNPSFEEYTECPSYGETGQGEFMKCKYWWYPTSPNVGTPDYINTCNNSDPSTPGFVGVPYNFLGNQYAFHGDAYVALATSQYNLSQEYSSKSSEIIATKLHHKLTPCVEYTFAMRVSLCELSSHACDDIQIHLSRDSLFFNNMNSIQSISPTWVNTAIIGDTLNWQLISTTFKTSGGEEFLYIGNFLKLDTLDYVFNNSYYSAQGAYIPYFYIDSISLYEVRKIKNCDIDFPNIFSPNKDGTNDVVNISYYGVEELFIYNRWGNLILELNESNPIWDGSHKGQDCSEGIYYYVGEYESQQLKGTIQLVR